MAPRRSRAALPCAASLPLLALALAACSANPEATPQAATPGATGTAVRLVSPETIDPTHGLRLPLLVLHNGVVWTGEPGRGPAQAIAVRGDRILAVGTDAEVLAHRDSATRVIDLQGHFVVPGFNDTHVHLQSAARFLEFNVMATGEQAEFLSRLQEAVAAVGPGQWIQGGFWGAYDQWQDGSAGGAGREPFAPDMRAAQAFTADNPVLLQKWDRSEFAANTAALRAFGIDPDEPEAPGVEFARDAGGRATGIFRGPGAARMYQGRAARPLPRARRLQQTRRALAEAARCGVTSLSDMSDDLQLQIYRELHERSELTVRVHFRPGLEEWPTQSERGVKVGAGDPWIRLGALKGHIDGIMGTSSARFFEPYRTDPDNRGSWRKLMVNDQGMFVPGKFLGHMLGADAAGLQLTVHAIGDQANHLLLEYLEELNGQNGARDRRFRLVHAQVIAAADMPRLGELGVVAEVQPFHLADDMRWMEERIGTERCKGAYAFRSIAQSGAVLAFGSDWPGTSASEYPIDPMLGIHAAVTRQTLKGLPAEGWFPDQRLSVEEALRAYTWAGAYASFEEDLKGTLAEGKLGDLAVLSRNLLECAPDQIRTTKVLCTVVGGRIVFEQW